MKIKNINIFKSTIIKINLEIKRKKFQQTQSIK